MKKHHLLVVCILFALLLSLCGVAASAFQLFVEVKPAGPVSVLTPEKAEPVIYERCANCDGVLVYDHTEKCSWSMTGYIDCPHGDRTVKDRQYERVVTHFFQCQNCVCGRQSDEWETRIGCRSKYAKP